MKRVAVIGVPFYELIMEFGKELSEKTGIPFCDLSEAFIIDEDFLQGKTNFEERERELVGKPTWVISGCSYDISEIHLDRCDTVVFLDYPRQVVEDLLDARLTPSQIENYWPGVARHYYYYRAEIVEKLGKYPNINIVILKNEEEKEEFLKNLSEKD